MQSNTKTTSRFLGAVILMGIINCAAVTGTVCTEDAQPALAKFSASLYQTAVPKSNTKNVILSPSGVSAVLSMTLAGSKGTTSAQIKNALQVTSFKDPVCAIGKLTRSDQQTSVMKSINQVLVAAGFSLKPTFISTVSNYFGAQVENIDFTSDQTPRILNERVESLTNNKINNLFSPDNFDALTRVILMNVVYFKGTWKQKFDPNRLQSRSFYSPSGPVNTTTMRTRGFFRVADFPEVDATALELPYSDNRTSMIILLPNKRDGLARLEAGFQSVLLDTMEDRTNRTALDLSMPKFTMETRVDLVRTLRNMGVTDLFGRGVADLSDMDGTKNLYVSNAFQRAYIQVNEEGTEAAAASVMIISARSARTPSYRRFKINRPFVFFIRDKQTKVIHFMGRFTTPE